MFPLFCRQNDLVLVLPAQTIDKTGLNFLIRTTNESLVKYLEYFLITYLQIDVVFNALFILA